MYICTRFTKAFEQDLNPAVAEVLSTRDKIIGLVVQLVIPSTRDCLSHEQQVL